MNDVLTVSFRGHQVTAEMKGGQFIVSVPEAAMLAASDGGPDKALDLALIMAIIELVMKIFGLFRGGE